MSILSDLAMMQKLVDVKYRQQQESFGRLILQENRLRSSLRQLDENLAESRAIHDEPLRAIGADIAWQAWVGRKKRELNLQLAKILAVKERRISQVRKAYGKVLVTNSLIDQVGKEQSQKKVCSELASIISVFGAK
ncbi:hypothetical protein [Sulfitobacter guttiformis]|uniref:Uncharacterized protein n=1 Tax=Sulfitobacter guttiformis TaxID=74349 RepID=A0A420DS63_9RHOB|nr:hypothetical protein [Sulfitobacter guttiformis]KIN74574.1 hypothetical protein Z949_3773 [Sulfitobacter guttiformis KCTC 32187]RKE97154.1 hypothetical protein C8N30_1747 [Sulfitobacter guttiformis]